MAVDSSDTGAPVDHQRPGFETAGRAPTLKKAGGELFILWNSFANSDKRLQYVMVAPAAIALLLLTMYPLAYSLWLSLHRYNMMTAMSFIGLGNYVRLLEDSGFWNSLKVTLVYSITSFTLEVLIGFGLALLLEEHIRRGKIIFRTLMILPLMMTPVVMGMTFRLMLDYDFGIVNWLIGLLGMSKQLWVSNPVNAMAAIIAIDVWQQVPFSLLIFSAGWAALPEEPLEAAKIDGANWWQMLWYVIIPMLTPLFLVVALFRSYSLLREFDLIFAVTGGGPGRATETLSYFIIEKMTRNWDFGYSAAVGWVLFGLSLLIGLLLIRGAGLKAQVDQ